MPRRPNPAGRNPRAGRPSSQRKTHAAKPRTPKAPDAKRPGVPAPQPAASAPAGPFVLGAIPGATPGKWIDAWQDRMPDNPLELRPLAVVAQRQAIVAGDVDAALVRLPIDKTGLHVIPLYDEVPVVATSTESHLTAADSLTPADLADEVLIIPSDDVLGLRADTFPNVAPPRFAPPASTEEAIATVAAGVGFVVVPMSLARLHHRKDVAYRPLEQAPTSTVALAWQADRTTALVDAFVGIVRGRTANSSRG
ncbi:LysR substrate-binding domain-containing protein [Microbacterium xanthum]|uniref:LysR substrate-binding domain-containing protein n=1 Tax=Microbacterium xanthum TaxID=3079794 RepID=UPI002AD4B60F|nr:LysR substrate-binding domain-containing protein [Microbacterium sp. KSW-48]MDZ8171606.1 LysR substrate-binding domain-containing protein [Microbacterium sp. KSW-48]